MLQLQKHVKLNVTPENHYVTLGLLLQMKNRQIKLKIVKKGRPLMANTVPFHLGTKAENILAALLTIQRMEKPGARLQSILKERSSMENGETVKMDVMFVRLYVIRIAFFHSSTEERSILSVLLLIQRMEKLGVRQK